MIIEAFAERDTLKERNKELLSINHLLQKSNDAFKRTVKAKDKVIQQKNDVIQYHKIIQREDKQHINNLRGVLRAERKKIRFLKGTLYLTVGGLATTTALLLLN